MNLKMIEAFVQVVDSGSVSEAARELGRGRSQVSTWLSDLEAEWNLELFERSGYRPVLTEYGQQLIMLCRQILVNVVNLEQRVERLGSHEESILNIGVDPLIPSAFRIRLITALYQQYPNVTISLIECSMYQISDKLENDDLHLAIGHLAKARLDKKIKSCFVSNLQFVTCARNDHPLADFDEVTEEDVQQHRGLFPNFIKEYLPVEFLDRYIALPDFDSIIEMTRMGSGWSISPLADVKPFLDTGELVILNHIAGVVRVGMGSYWLRNTALSDAGQWLVGNLENLWEKYQTSLSEKADRV